MLMVYFSIFQIVSATPGKTEEPSKLTSTPKISTKKGGVKATTKTGIATKTQTTPKHFTKPSKAKTTLVKIPVKTPKTVTTAKVKVESKSTPKKTSKTPSKK